MAMDEIQKEYFFEETTTVHYGTEVKEIRTGLKSFQLTATVSAGTGVIAADIETSHDGVIWNWAANFSIATVTTSGVGVLATLTNAHKYHRVNLYTITGTDCTATASVCYLD